MVTSSTDLAVRSRVNLAAKARLALQILLALVACALCARAIYYLWMAADLVRWPFELHGGESTMVLESRLLNNQGLLAGFRRLYGPQQTDSFVGGNYPPIYYLVWTLKPGPPAYPTGRAISLLAGLVAAVAGGVAAYAALPGSRLVRVAAGALGGAAFICTVPVFQQLSIAKPDMLALALAAVGLMVFEVRRDRAGAVAAGVCFALAVLTKQSVGFALVAAMIAALRRDWRTLLTLVASVAGFVLVVLGALWLVSGPPLFEHLVLYNLGRDWRQDRFDSLASKMFFIHWPLLVPAVAYALWGVWRRPRSALTYYPLIALLTFATVGSEGGARNYFVELCLAIGLGAALAVGTLLISRPPLAPVLGAALLALLVFYTYQTYTLLVVGKYVPTRPYVTDAYKNDVLALVEKTPDPILSDDVNYMAMLNRPAVIDDNFLATFVREQGYWHDDGIIANVAARKYPLILIPRSQTDEQLRQLWGDPLVDAILANYRRTGDYTFVPK
ncbi:MAG: hypothetical protein ACTHMU_23155 [Thermomicrobiales bacterium]